MPSYLKKDNNLLIVPNKCASMYVDLVCRNRILTENQVTNLLPEIESGEIQVTAIKRDPVDWYWSGFWHVSSSRDILPVIPTRWTPLQHWRFASERKRVLTAENPQRDEKYHKNLTEKYRDFDMHSWIDPWNQVYYTQVNTHGVPMPPNTSVTWIDLNSEEFTDLIDSWATNRHYIKDKINQSNKIYWPMKEQYVTLLHNLDDWSWRLGYDLNDSIKRYRKLEKSHR